MNIFTNGNGKLEKSLFMRKIATLGIFQPLNEIFKEKLLPF